VKAEVPQQRTLLELTELDADVSRLEHRVKNLTEQQRLDEIAAEHRTALDEAAVVDIALEDLDAEVARYETEIDAVRQREDRDRAMLESGTINPKQLADIQHELETLQRRQSSLEDDQLEVMERREQLQNQKAEQRRRIDELQESLNAAQIARDAALVALDGARETSGLRRTQLVATLDADLVKLYERQRANGGPGAGVLQGRRCGSCRIEIDRADIARIAAAPLDEVIRCPECGAILLRQQDWVK
jgi:predicted  nucleic acid-binding Zn-ribbon protein